MDINIDKLREDLIDYFMAAMFNVSPVALMDLTKVENAGDEEIIKIALKNNFDLGDYSRQYGDNRYRRIK